MDTTDLEREIHDAACGLIADTGDRDLTLRTARVHLHDGKVQVQAVCLAEPDRGEVTISREYDGRFAVTVECDGRERTFIRATVAEAYALAWKAVGERHD